jgi:hypothetical protein
MPGQCSTSRTTSRTRSSPSTTPCGARCSAGSVPRRPRPRRRTTKVRTSPRLPRCADRPGPALTRARTNLADGERALADAQRAHDDAVRELGELFSPARLGAQGEWKKLEKQCLALDAGEYTYEVCLFDEARQKPNHGGQTFSLGCVPAQACEREGTGADGRAQAVLGVEHGRAGGERRVLLEAVLHGRRAVLERARALRRRAFPSHFIFP